MKILVTGGLGTIGSCLASRLFLAGNEVVIYDNMEIGNINNLKVYLSDDQVKKIKIIRRDILDKEHISFAISDCEMVYHLAATLGTLNVVSQPSRMLNVNSLGTHIVADLCVSKGIPLVLMSTSMIYGKNNSESVRESDDLFVGGNVDVGLWWYAISKIADEAYAKSLMLENSEAKIMIVRPFNVIAPVQSHIVGFVFPRFFRSAFRNEPLKVYGDGSQQRTFTWAHDFVDCLLMLVEKEQWRDTFNIGGTEATTILELARRIIKVADSKSEIVFTNPQEVFKGQFVEIPQRVPNVDHLSEKIGVVPKTSLSTMLSNFNEFYKTKALQSDFDLSRY